MQVKFSFLIGDVNWLEYGGTWISQKFNNGEFDYWIVREIINWEEAQGSLYDNCKYHVQLSCVAPEQFVDRNRALSSCGDDHNWSELSDEAKVLIVYEYSGGATIWQRDGSNYQKLFKECQLEAIAFTSILFGIHLDRPMNRLGATGWDFLTGEIVPNVHTVENLIAVE